MCGRYVAASNADDLARYFDVDQRPEALVSEVRANFNVAPTSDVMAVFERNSARHLDLFRWGLVPRWAKDLKIGNRMINARAETLSEKNAFKSAYKKRRCIIPADGFYEWKKIPGVKTKQPMFIHRADGDPFAFAGLWETWKPKAEDQTQKPKADAEDVEAELIHTCTIITGLPNEAVREVHDRMPVMLAPSDWAQWLDPGFDDLDELNKLLVPAPADIIAMHPVSTEVNNVRNRGAHLMDEIPPDQVVAPDGALPL